MAIYNKEKEKENKKSKEGECGRILEYYFENKDFEIINYLKKYLGFGDLLNKVDLIVDEDLSQLHSYIKNKLNDSNVQLLFKEKTSNFKNKKNELDENDEDKYEKKNEGDEEEEGEKGEKEEEEEEEEEEDDEKSEETKKLLNLETD